MKGFSTASVIVNYTDVISFMKCHVVEKATHQIHIIVKVSRKHLKCLNSRYTSQFR